MVIAYLIGLCPNIPHKERIFTLKEKLEEQTSSKILSYDLELLIKLSNVTLLETPPLS